MIPRPDVSIYDDCTPLDASPCISLRDYIMLADLLLPFPTSHPSTVPSDLIHPPLRNGIPFLLPLVLLLVCAFSCSSSFSSLIPFYILRFGLFCVLLPSPHPRFSFFNLHFPSAVSFPRFSPFFPSFFDSRSFFELTFPSTRGHSLDSKYRDIAVSIL